jgi:hypothetical protein
MSFRKKGRNFRTKSGRTFPNSSDRIASLDEYEFTTGIAETLRDAYGDSGRAIKTVMAYTGAGERTVKNWFQAENGPNGENLIQLMCHSDEVLEAVLLMSGREDILMAKMLVDARDAVVEMLEIMDRLQGSDLPEQSSSN